MISNAKLAEVFQIELRETRSVEAAIAAVRLCIEVEHERAQEAGSPHRCSRGPKSVSPLGQSDVAELQALVAEELGVPVAEVLRGPSRDCVEARYVLCAALRRLKLSFPAIARALRQKHHTRAMDAVARVREERGLAERLERVLGRLRERGWVVPEAVLPPVQDARVAA